MESKKAILLVEACTEDGLSTHQALDELGFGDRVIRSATASGALTYLREAPAERPGVILLSLDELHREGLDTLRAIKADEQLRAIPVVVFGPAGHAHIVDESFGLGAAGYVAKSPEWDTLRSTIQAVCEYWSLSEVPK